MTIAEIVKEMKPVVVALGNMSLFSGSPDSYANVLHGPVRQIPAEFLTIPGSQWLIPLYTEFDGLKFPDVHNAYFIDRIQEISPHPSVLILDREFLILPFGQTGGGDLFVVDVETGAVMILPPGLIEDGRYDGRGSRVKTVATSVAQFVERLAADLKAFVSGDLAHVYLDKIY